MKEVKIVVEEVYKIERQMTLYMSEQQYTNWINDTHSPIDSLFKKSTSVSDFLKRTREMKENKRDCGFEKVRLSNYEKDIKHKENIGFDIVYINSGK